MSKPMNLQQGTPAWFNARKGKLTASNFGAAAGVNPYCSRKKQLRLTLGLEKWKGNNDACRWGTNNEKNAVKDYMVRTGNIVKDHGISTHPDYAWLGGSPDGLIGDDGMIEAKCPFVNKVCHTKIPLYYYCQINGLMEILNREWCDYISWTPTEMKVYRVYRDRELFDFLMEKYMLFFACMQRGCDCMPNMSSADKAITTQRIEDSDAKTDYGFWTAVEPGNLKGKWEGPPDDPYLSYSSDSTQEGSPSSKRGREDGTNDIRKMLKPVCSTAVACTA
jgi:putative phage-type endonuclease